MGAELTDWIQAGSSVLTLASAIVAVTIAAKAPRLAAKFADDYRRQSAAAEERQRFQMVVFVALMKCRRELLNADARGAVNLVDVAFPDSLEVLNARRLFIEATEKGTPDMVVERYYSLTEAVSRAMGFSHHLNGQDIRSGWHPSAMASLDLAAIMEAEEKLAHRNAVKTEDGK